MNNIYKFENFSNFYNELNSNTFNISPTINCTILKDSNSKPIAEQICLSNETFYFLENLNDMKKTSKKKELEFYLTKNTLDNITGIIGLNLNSPDRNKITEKSFLSILNENNIIDDYHWYFDLDKWDDKSGKLVICKLPHEIKNNFK